MIHPREDYQHIQDPSGKIPADEPVFLLRAQDKVAAATVRIWSILNEITGGDVELSNKAWAHALKMQDWPVKKLADEPTEVQQGQNAEEKQGVFQLINPVDGQLEKL